MKRLRLETAAWRCVLATHWRRASANKLCSAKSQRHLGHGRRGHAEYTVGRTRTVQPSLADPIGCHSTAFWPLALKQPRQGDSPGATGAGDRPGQLIRPFTLRRRALPAANGEHPAPRRDSRRRQPLAAQALAPGTPACRHKTQARTAVVGALRRSGPVAKRGHRPPPVALSLCHQSSREPRPRPPAPATPTIPTACQRDRKPGGRSRVSFQHPHGRRPCYRVRAPGVLRKVPLLKAPGHSPAAGLRSARSALPRTGERGVAPTGPGGRMSAQAVM